MNIEVAQKKVRKDDDSDEENDVSPETGQETKPETQKSPPEGNSIPNGILKNGYLNHNGTSLINREDNLILLPEPNKNHSANVANGAADSENTDENVVSSDKVDFFLTLTKENQIKIAFFCNTIYIFKSCTHGTVYFDILRHFVQY